MQVDQAIRVLESLAQGVDPDTGEVFPPESPYQRPDTVRALHAALGALRRSRRARVRPDGPSRAGQPWTAEEEGRLAEAFSAGASVLDLARAHDRTASAIHNRLVTLGLVEPGPG